MTDTRLAQARDHFLQGVALYEAGRYADAEQQFAAALALAPGRASVLTNLGAVRLKLGRAADALALLDEALAQDPGSAEALGHRGTALAELGHLPEALDSFDRSLAIAPAQPAAWMQRGSVLKDLGRAAEAIASFEKSLAHGGDTALNAYYLASLRGGAAPSAPPQHYVQALFDGYAGDFDEHLVRQLHYDAPAVLARHIAATGRRFARALDLGCGTGLCGRALAPVCGEIYGVDLSAAMLARAEATGVYRSLTQADVVQYLQAATERYDLVVAADVFIYVGALEGVFDGIARVLQPRGVVACTVETAEADFVLRPSLRYAHSEPYLRRLASGRGLVVTHAEHRPVREDQRVPIPGLFLWLERSS